MSGAQRFEPFVVRGRAERPLPDLPSDPDLHARIVDEIRRRGPMTFARFMELALYDPERGYYSSPEPRPTREGDFLTAPELEPIFGRAVARQVAEVWRRIGSPEDFTIREDGAGSGALAISILDGLRADAPELAPIVRYAPIEHNRHRLAELRSRLIAAGHRPPLSTPPVTMAGVVIANEFLDALPVHRVVGSVDPPGELMELYVDVGDGGYREVAARASTPALATRLAAEGVALAPGQRAEIRLDDAAWVAEVSRNLRVGAVIVVDYGLDARELYDRSRPDGTLLAYVGHRAHTDPFRSVGRQDLTAHVDLTSLRRAAVEAGLDVLGDTSQAEFLMGNGLEALLDEVRSDAGTDVARWAALRSAIARLLDPRMTGGFRVLVLGRGLGPEPPLAGLSFRLARP